MTPIAGPSLWTLLVLLFLAAVIDLVCPLASSSTTLPTTTTTSVTPITPVTPISTTTIITSPSKVSPFNASSLFLPPSTNSSSVHTFSFTYSSASKKNQTDGRGAERNEEDEEDDLAEAESSYALEEDDEDNGGGGGGGDFDGTFDEDNNGGSSSSSNSGLDGSANFDHLNDLLSRSALSPAVSPSTADHYQVLNNRSASLKDFYDALTAQEEAAADSQDGLDGSDSVASSANTEAVDADTDDTEGGDGGGRQTIRLPSITTTTIVNGGKSGLENRQDFLLPGSLQAASSPSSSSSSTYNYHRQQQLALYNQLSQMVQNSIANARGLGPAKGAKGNSYVATGKKSLSPAAAAASASSGKSKKLQIVYIKVPLLNLLEKGPRAADYSGIEGVSGDTDYDTSSSGGGGGGLADTSSDDGIGSVQQSQSNFASNHDANALSAIAQLASSQPVSSTTAQLFQSLMNLKANYLQQNGSAAAGSSAGSNDGGQSLSEQQLQDLYTPWTPVNSGNSQSKLVSWSSGNTLGPSQTKASPDSSSSASSPKPTYIGQHSRHHHHSDQVSSSFQGSKSAKDDPDTSSSSSYSSYSRHPMESTVKTSTSTTTTTTTTTTTPSPYYSKYRYGSSSSSSFSSKFPSFSSSFSNSSSPSKYYWSSHWNSTTSSRNSSPFKSWSSYRQQSHSVPSTAESAPPSRTTASSSEEYSGVTSKPLFAHYHDSNVPPHNHVYQPAVHGQFSSSYNNDEEGKEGNYSENGGGKKRHLGLGILPIVIQIDSKALREEQEQALRSGRGGAGSGSGADQPIRGTGGLNLRSILQQLDSSTDNLPTRGGSGSGGGHIHYQQPPRQHHSKHQNFNSNRGQNYHGSASSWSSSLNFENGPSGGNFNSEGPAYGGGSNNNNNHGGKATATITIEKPYPGPVSNADQIDDSQWPGKMEFISSPFAKNNNNNNQHPQNSFLQQKGNNHNLNNHHHQNQASFNPGNNHLYNHNHHQQNHHQNPHHHSNQHISWNDNTHFFNNYNNNHNNNNHRLPFNTDYMTSASSNGNSSPNDNYNNRRRPGQGCQRQQPKKKPPCSRGNKSQFKHSSASMLPSASNIDFDDGVFFSRLPGFNPGDGSSSSSSSNSNSNSNSNFFSRRPLGGALSRHLAKSRRQKAFQKSLQSALLTGSGFPGSWTTMPLPEGSSQALQNFYSELLGSSSASFDTNPFTAQSSAFLNFPPAPLGALDTSASVSSPVFNQPPVILSPQSSPPLSPPLPPPPPPPPAVIAAQLAVAAAASGQLPPLPPLSPPPPPPAAAQITSTSSSQTQVALPLLKKENAPNLQENKDSSTAPQKGGSSSSSRFRFWSPFAAAISRTDKLAKQLTTFRGKSKLGSKSTSSSSFSAKSPTSTAAVSAASSLASLSSSSSSS